MITQEIYRDDQLAFRIKTQFTLCNLKLLKPHAVDAKAPRIQAVVFFYVPIH